MLWIHQLLLLAIIFVAQWNVLAASGNDGCIELADFFYEIVLSVSTFPQAICNNLEEVEMSRFLEIKIEQVLNNLPGTIQTRNRLCSHPVNKGKRKLLAQVHNETKSEFSDKTKTLQGNGKMARLLAGQNLRRHIFHNFIYVGGGRCRYCFRDNADKLRFLNANSDLKLMTKQGKVMRRNLLFFETNDSSDDGKSPVPTVADASLCNKRFRSRLFGDSFYKGRYKKGWTNGRGIDMGSRSRIGSILGPYAKGESFGIVHKGVAQRHQSTSTNKKRLDPVAAVNIEFDLWEIDVPNRYAGGRMMADDPLFLYINGIKIDLELLIAAPNTRFSTIQLPRPIYSQTSWRVARGNSFAGIKWKIQEKLSGRDFGFGPQEDREYEVRLEVPEIIFDHKNEINIEFFVKPQAKAKKYGIDSYGVSVVTVGCKVIGLEDSPFDEFKQVTEKRLREQLGLDLATEFQSKDGHCLEDKIPVVDIHLVEKTEWNEANPRCE